MHCLTRSNSVIGYCLHRRCAFGRFVTIKCRQCYLWLCLALGIMCNLSYQFIGQSRYSRYADGVSCLRIYISRHTLCLKAFTQHARYLMQQCTSYSVKLTSPPPYPRVVHILPSSPFLGSLFLLYVRMQRILTCNLKLVSGLKQPLPIPHTPPRI